MKAHCYRALWVTLLCLGVVASSSAANPPERQERDALRVCADGNNKPFSNQAGEGFENRIAELMAEDMGVPLTYVWSPQIMRSEERRVGKECRYSWLRDG